MLKVGLTGGIGSGKSTVTHLFADLGVPVIDADIIAREVLVSNKTILTTITQHFGQQVLDGTGNLDRAYLRKIIFEQQAERRWLEALLHPLILAEMECQASQVQFPYCLLVIPLLIESALSYALVDRVLVVDTSEETQIERTCRRDKLTKEAVRLILKAQATRAERLELADDVITNNGDMDALVSAVQQMHRRFLALASNAGPEGF